MELSGGATGARALLESLLFVAHGVDDRLQRGAVRGLRLAIKVPDVDEIGDGYLARRNALEERRLAAAVLGNQSVAVAIRELERLVLKQLLPEQRDREGLRGARGVESSARVATGARVEDAAGAGNRERSRRVSANAMPTQCQRNATRAPHGRRARTPQRAHPIIGGHAPAP